MKKTTGLAAPAGVGIRAINAVGVALLAVGAGWGSLAMLSHVVGLRDAHWGYAYLFGAMHLGVFLVGFLAARAHWKWGRGRSRMAHWGWVAAVFALASLLDWVLDWTGLAATP